MQRYYGIDLDRAMNGEHSPHHIAQLVSCLPAGAQLRIAFDEDAKWSAESTLLAFISNQISMWMWGMSDKAKRGAKPELIGPSWMRSKKSKLETQVMSVSQLMAELSKERR